MENTLRSRFSQDSISADHGRNKYLPLLKIPPNWRRSSTINSDLKRIMGKDKTLFECSGNGTKVAVTATRSKDSSTCIFSNYNGSKKKFRGYNLIRSQNPKNEMLVWHM
jgi:hypothetical protein